MTTPTDLNAPLPAVPAQPESEDAFTPVHEVSGPNSSTSIFELADRLVAWKEHKKALEQHVKDANEVIAKIDTAMVERMVDEEVESFKRDGRTFYITSGRAFASPRAGMKEALIEWLSKNDHDAIVAPSVNAQTLGSLCKELADASETGELPDDLAEIVNYHRPTTVGTRKA